MEGLTDHTAHRSALSAKCPHAEKRGCVLGHGAFDAETLIDRGPSTFNISILLLRDVARYRSSSKNDPGSCLLREKPVGSVRAAFRLTSKDEGNQCNYHESDSKTVLENHHPGSLGCHDYAPTRLGGARARKRLAKSSIPPAWA